MNFKHGVEGFVGLCSSVGMLLSLGVGGPTPAEVRELESMPTLENATDTHREAVAHKGASAKFPLEVKAGMAF